MLTPRSAQWWFFGVGVGALPVLLLAFKLLYDHRLSFTGVLGHGDLFLVSVAVAAPLLGPLVVQGHQRPVASQVVGGMIAICVALAAFSYAIASSDTAARGGTLAVVSLIEFCLVAILGAVSIGITEES